MGMRIVYPERAPSPVKQRLRVVSLLPCATDTLDALGLVNLLIGRSHECDAISALAVRVCTEAKFGPDHGMSSREIHDAASTAGAAVMEAVFGPLPRVATLVEWSLSPYRVDPFTLRDLQPDVVLTQLQAGNEGALTHEDVEVAVEEWVRKPVRVVHMDPQNLAAVWDDMRSVARAVGERARGDAVVDSLRRRMEAVSLARLGRSPRRVLCVQWLDPLFAAGAWVPELLSMMGAIDVVFTQEDNGQTAMGGSGLTWDKVKEARPEAVLFAICGCSLEQSLKELRRILGGREKGGGGGGEGVVGILKGGVISVVVDAARLFSRPGPSLVESMEVLAEVLYPGSGAAFGHKGRLWQPLKLDTLMAA